ncbi:unnamed protein product [Notodromas monacha]|uniref:Uncharacterized protein n=1 Tax=Notodromas monacha TaxID=399045 RepID=A0A7R9BG52_9CRUS|nr:unnamed protein product [Notodromas monacha]CAG0914848.1 unnamed protein product [Notodromas monacha]
MNHGLFVVADRKYQESTEYFKCNMQMTRKDQAQFIIQVSQRYTTEEARNCMKTASQNTSRPNLFVFGGDSTMRGFFTDFVDHFTYRKWHPFSQNDVFWQDPKIRLHVYYMWQTFVDSPWLIPFFGAKPAKNLKPSLLVASGGVWALAFKKNMLRWAAEINATGIPMIWRIQATVSNTHLPNDKQVWVTAEMTEKLNSVATGVVEKYDRFRIWNTGANALKQLIVKTNKVLFRDWVHVCHASHEYEIQVLLNFYCNRFTNLGTCCDTYPSFTETDREKLHPDLSTRRIIICSFTVVWFLAICSCFWSLVVKNYPIKMVLSADGTNVKCGLDAKSRKVRLFREFVSKLWRKCFIAGIAGFAVLLIADFFGILRSPKTSCHALLETGNLLPNGTWQPLGCQAFEYDTEDVLKCFRDRKLRTSGNSYLGFYGDRELLQLLLIIHRKIAFGHWEKYSETDRMYTSHGKYVNLGYLNRISVERVVDWFPPNEYNEFPTLVVMNPYLVMRPIMWEIPKIITTSVYTKTFKETMSQIQKISENQTVIWRMYHPRNPETEEILGPQQFSGKEYSEILNNIIQNNYTESEKMWLWTNTKRIEEEVVKSNHANLTYANSKLRKIAEINAQILLNFYCNKELRLTSEFCCSGMTEEFPLYPVEIRILLKSMLNNVLEFNKKRLRNFSELLSKSWLVILVAGVVGVMLIFFANIFGSSRSHKTTCHLLLETGKLLPSGIWQPSGCQTFVYTSEDILQCFKHRKLKTSGNSYLGFYGDIHLLRLMLHLHKMIESGSWEKYSESDRMYTSRGKFVNLAFMSRHSMDEIVDWFPQNEFSEYPSLIIWNVYKMKCAPEGKLPESLSRSIYNKSFTYFKSFVDKLTDDQIMLWRFYHTRSPEAEKIFGPHEFEGEENAEILNSVMKSRHKISDKLWLWTNTKRIEEDVVKSTDSNLTSKNAKLRKIFQINEYVDMCWKPLKVHRVLERLFPLRSTLAICVGAAICIISIKGYKEHIKAGLGLDTCKWMLQTGNLQSDRTWKPFGCSMHWYSAKQARDCLQVHQNLSGISYIGILGDSRMRGLFTEINDAFSGIQWHFYEQTDTVYNFSSHHLKVAFLWRPVVYEKTVFPRLGKRKRPELVVAGFGPWYFGIDAGFLNFARILIYRRQLRQWAKFMSNYMGDGHVIFRLQHTTSDIHPPKPSQETFTNDVMSQLNKVAIEVFAQFPRIYLWTNSQRVSESLVRIGKVIYRDWLHLCHATHEFEVQMLLNFFCNRFGLFEDGTCCDQREVNFDNIGEFVVPNFVAKPHHVIKYSQEMKKTVNANIVLLIIVLPYSVFLELCFIESRMHDKRDTCQLLFETGKFEGKNWKPEGCSLHLYTPAEAKICFRTTANQTGRMNYFGFLGDSRMRDSYSVFLAEFSYKRKAAVLHTDIMTFDKDSRTMVKFIWQPYLYENSYFPQARPQLYGPSVIVASVASWYLMTFWTMHGAETLAFKRQIKIWGEALVAQFPATTIIWKFQQYPSYQNIIPPSHVNITDDRYQEFNKIAESVFTSTQSDVFVWKSIRSMAEGMKYSGKKVYRDYLHPGYLLYQIEAQILYNFYCNQVMLPRDGTCCRTLRQTDVISGFESENMKVANRIEKVSGIICWVVLPALIFLHSKTGFHWLHDDKESCGSLLTTGSFSRISNKWRPSLCSLHWYTKPEVITCAKKRAIRANRTEYIAFLGDSRIRDSFYAFIDIFDYRQYHPVASFEDMQFDVPGQDIVIQFMWRPYLIDFPDTHFYHLTPDGQGLVTLVHGAAAWYLMTFWDMKGAELIAYRRQLKVSLDKISEELPHTQIIWKFQVQTSYQDKPPWSHVNITDKVFEEFNRVSQDLIVSENYDNMWIWSSHRHVAESLKTSGGRRIVNKIIWKIAAILTLGSLSIFLITQKEIKYENDLCLRPLLQTGKLRRDLTWKPNGCEFRWYNSTDSMECVRRMNGTYFAFAGDSRMRELYNTFVAQFSPVETKFNERIDHEYIPVLPDVIIAGAAFWYMAFWPQPDAHAVAFERHLRQFAETMLADDTQPLVLWKLQYPISNEHPPLPFQTMITNEKIGNYNDISWKVLRDYENVWVWSSGVLAAQDLMQGRGKKVFRDYVHLCYAVQEIEVQQLLNLFCNRLMAQEHAGFCCSQLQHDIQRP